MEAIDILECVRTVIRNLTMILTEKGSIKVGTLLGTGFPNK